MTRPAWIYSRRAAGLLAMAAVFADRHDVSSGCSTQRVVARDIDGELIVVAGTDDGPIGSA
jgi:hypothetical protein